MTEFNPSAWSYHGDRTPVERVMRVFEHYGTEYWWVDDSIRFVSSNEDLVSDVERAIGDAAILERVRVCRDKTRYRISEPHY